jgi:formaldehyde-activating enzyme involved in methanogenesis
MPARKKAYHTYSVFVSTIVDAETTDIQMIYFGSSVRACQVAFARAIMNHPNAYAALIRRDMKTIVRVTIERPD